MALSVSPEQCCGSSQGYLCSLPGKSERSSCQGNSKEPSDKLTNFPFAPYFSPLISFWKSFGEISERAVSATSLLLHHSEHCNIIKLVKRKPWCLSFLQTARCSFQGEQHPRLCLAPVGEGRIPLSFLKYQIWLSEQKKNPQAGFWICLDPSVQWIGEWSERDTWILDLVFGRVHPINPINCFQFLKDNEGGI